MNYLDYLCVVLVTQSCPTLCDFVDCSPPGSSVHGILQARILEWVAISFKGSFQPREGTQVSSTAGRFFTVWATREVNYLDYLMVLKSNSKCLYKRHSKETWNRRRRSHEDRGRGWSYAATSSGTPGVTKI